MRLLFSGLLLCSIALCRPLAFERRSPDLYQTGKVAIRPGAVLAGGVQLRFAGASLTTPLESIGRPSPATYIENARSLTVPQFPKVAMRRLYPGVDAIFYGNGEHLEYDLVTAPGADLGRIRLHFDAAREVRLDSDGNLHVEAAGGGFTHRRPRVFQADGRLVEARYVFYGRNEVRFQIGPHDRRLGLTIDPELVFTRYFGGSATDSATAIATDSQGSVYIAGFTNSVDFPAPNGGLANRPGAAPVATLAGSSITPLPIGSESSALVIGGTPDGSVLYAICPDTVYVSSDHGATWTQRGPFPVQQQTVINAINVDAIDPSRVFVATNGGLFGSNDGGTRWFSIATGRYTSVQVSPLDHLVVYAASTQPSAILKSTNGGYTYSPLVPDYPVKPTSPLFQDSLVALAPNGNDVYAVDQYAMLIRSNDNGTTWQALSQVPFGVRTLLIDPLNDSNIYILDGLGVRRSSDGGRTFSTLAQATFGPLNQIALDAKSENLYFTNGSILRMVPTQGGSATGVPLATSFLRWLGTYGGQVYAGFDVPTTAYITKWDATGNTLLYSTFFSGAQQTFISALAVDAQGQCTAAGYASSPDFPVTVRFGSPGATQGAPSGFVTRLSSDGARIVYSALLGGSKAIDASIAQTSTFLQGMALDSSGAAYFTGQTYASDFPVSSNAFQSGRPASACNRKNNNFFTNPALAVNGFAGKISVDGSQLLYSTLITGSCGSGGQAIAVNAAGEAVVSGYTTSSDLPVSAGTYQPSFPGDPNLSGPPNTTVVGFAARFSAAGDRLLAGTYLGGSYATRANGVALDAQGNVYLTGGTARIVPGATPGAYQSTAEDRCSFPISIGPSIPYGGTGDAFLLKLDPTLSTAGFMTYLGGGCDDSGNAIALDRAGNAWISGTTASRDFPSKSPFQGSGIGTYFVSEISADGGRLLFSSATDTTALTLDGSGAVYLAGAGATSTVPKRVQVFGNTGTAAEWSKIDPTATRVVTIDSVLPVSPFPQVPLQPASFGLGIAPGQLMRITGSHLGPAARVDGQFDATGRLPFTLSGTTVRFDNLPAPLLSVEDGSVVCVAPFEVSQTSTVAVEAGGQRSNSVRLGIAVTNPQILSVVNQDGSVNSAAHPANPGEILVLYASGLGQTKPLSADGLINSGTPTVPVAPVSVYVGPPLPLEFEASAPGQVAGIVQINVRLPVQHYSPNPFMIRLANTGAPVYVAQ